MSISFPTVSLAQAFEDCAIVGASLATPFVQSRTQLAILNVETSQATPCKFVEFRLAEIDGDIDVQIVNEVQIRTWKETWGVTVCGQPAAFNVWYKEIGLGGMSYQVVREEYPLRTFLRRVAAAVPSDELETAAASNEEPAATEKKEQPESTEAPAAPPVEKETAAEPSVEKETAKAPDTVKADEEPEEGGVLSGLKSLFSDDAAAKEVDDSAEKESAVTETATKNPETTAKKSSMDVVNRELALTKPPMKGHDVCAIQRALLDRGHEVTVDGVFGPGVKKALGEFQKGAGLEASGKLDEPTRQALAFRAPPVSSGENPEAEKPEKSSE